MQTASQIVRVSKKFTFDMAHALYGYDGPCKNIHGHTYMLTVTLRGTILNQANTPKNGMVIDFTDFKQIVSKAVLNEFDHSLVLNAFSPHANLNDLNDNFEKINYVPYQPTCENMLLDFLDRIRKKLPINVTVSNIKLEETPSSYAEWFIEDNM
jgi:6-pyruvoyltetrahydropterin/6-carboxytetrahydropterin synthase